MITPNWSPGVKVIELLEDGEGQWAYTLLRADVN
jgi:hypothetical protein